jgi:signal transduction histidine kinase
VVVDDNNGFRESLIQLLRAGGHEVAGEASDGLQALEVVAATEPDVVLMDIRMPAMDGIEATRRLRAARPGLGVVALTAQEDQTVVREMLVAGASGYVLKDSDGEDILNAVVQAAHGGAVISPAVTPAVIEQLTEALERERQRTRELEEAHAVLVERTARRHEFVSRLGHELRTPVTVILGVARTLLDRKTEPGQQRELLERLAGRAADLSRLVERFESAMDEGSEDIVDIVRLARRVAGDLQRVRVSEGTGVAAVWANRVLVRRILEELVDNACRFSPPQSFVDVEVTRSRDHRSVEVRVTDRGSGVRPEDRERIFEPLEQGERLDARTHQGAGVGLSLGRAAARAMSGDLVLERSDETGSTFLWTLPVAAR